MSTPALAILTQYLQELEDCLNPKRHIHTVLCPPGLKPSIDDLIDRYGLTGVYEVVQSDYTNGQIFIFNHKAAQAALTAEAQPFLLDLRPE